MGKIDAKFGFKRIAPRLVGNGSGTTARACGHCWRGEREVQTDLPPYQKNQSGGPPPTKAKNSEICTLRRYCPFVSSVSLMKTPPILACLLLVSLSACSTKFYSYSGAKVITGTGGASKKVDGIDLWIEGTPPRNFQIVGVIHDHRPGRGISMLLRDGKIAAVAKQQGGDGVLLSFDA